MYIIVNQAKTSPLCTIIKSELKSIYLNCSASKHKVFNSFSFLNNDHNICIVGTFING